MDKKSLKHKNLSQGFTKEILSINVRQCRKFIIHNDCIIIFDAIEYINILNNLNKTLTKNYEMRRDEMKQ